jgi:plasmid stability protein
MRTTVDIPDGMYRQLKSRAAREGSSTRALILRGVKEVLKAERRILAWISWDEPPELEPCFRALTRLR